MEEASRNRPTANQKQCRFNVENVKGLTLLDFEFEKVNMEVAHFLQTHGAKTKSLDTEKQDPTSNIGERVYGCCRVVVRAWGGHQCTRLAMSFPLKSCITLWTVRYCITASEARRQCRMQRLQRLESTARGSETGSLQHWGLVS